MKRVALLSAALLLSVTASFGSGVLVEAESFRDKGGWAVDQQFMDQMGSPYLIAHGMGKPVADAVTTVEFQETGTYRVYVRTFNWVAPWYDGEGPGKFALRVGSRKLSATLGCTGSEWMWQCAGKVSVRKGPVSVSLTDLSGFDGRCDAVYFTTEEGDVPPSGSAELAAFRKRMLGIPATPQTAESFDFVVVGGGIAGMCAAAAASRLGCSVALVNDRPVLGGNHSSEIRVHLGGVIDTHHGEEISGIALTKTDAGRDDPLLKGTPDRFHSYVGHHEAVRELAPGMQVLLAGDDTPIQMVRVGEAAWATQFHPEMDLDGVNIRIDQYAGRYYPAEKAEAIRAQVVTVDTDPSRIILRNFVSRFQR